MICGSIVEFSFLSGLSEIASTACTRCAPTLTTEMVSYIPFIVREVCQNIARIANAVQVTICILVSTSVYYFLLVSSNLDLNRCRWVHLTSARPFHKFDLNHFCHHWYHVFYEQNLILCHIKTQKTATIEEYNESISLLWIQAMELRNTLLDIIIKSKMIFPLHFFRMNFSKELVIDMK